MTADSPQQQACDRKVPTGRPGAGHPREEGPERRAVNPAMLRVRPVSDRDRGLSHHGSYLFLFP